MTNAETMSQTAEPGLTDKRRPWGEMLANFQRRLGGKGAGDKRQQEQSWPKCVARHAISYDHTAEGGGQKFRCVYAQECGATSNTVAFTSH